MNLPNPSPGFFLHPKGITVCCAGVEVGARGVVNGVEYEAVDNALLRQRIKEKADLTRVCTSMVTNMNRLFSGDSRFNQNISTWDTSGVTTMVGTFEMAGSFNQPIGAWDTSRVKNMSRMFAAAFCFNQDIGGWNTARLTGKGLLETFLWAESFNKDLSGWDVSRVTTLESTFEGALSFNQPLAAWNVRKVRSLKKTFRNARSFNQPLNDWDVRAVVSMQATFEGAYTFNQPLDGWNVSKVQDFGRMFFKANAFNQTLNRWNPPEGAIVRGFFEDMKERSEMEDADHDSEEHITVFSGELPSAWSSTYVFSDYEPEGYEDEFTSYTVVGSVDYGSITGPSRVFMYTYKGFALLVDEDEGIDEDEDEYEDSSGVYTSQYALIATVKKRVDDFLENTIPEHFYESDEPNTLYIENYLQPRLSRSITFPSSE